LAARPPVDARIGRRYLAAPLPLPLPLPPLLLLLLLPSNGVR
jgi:hypothetical protein